MSRLKVTETFERRGDTFEEGKTYVVAEELAEWAERKGKGSRPGKGTERSEIPKLEAPETGSVWEELKAEAKSRSDKPPSWDPEKGDWLFGTIERTGEGKDSRFAVVRVAERVVRAKSKLKDGSYGKEIVQPGDEVLLWEVKDLNDFFDKIRGGSKVAVQYTGEARTSSGHMAKLYDCAIRG